MSAGKPKITHQLRLLQTLVYIGEADVDTFLPLSYHKIVETFEHNTKHQMRVCGYSVADMVKIGFLSPHHYYGAGYRATDLIADEGLLYGLLAHFHPLAITQAFMRCADDALLLAGTVAHRDLEIDLQCLLWRCVGRPRAAREVIQRAIGGGGAAYGVPVALLEDCGLSCEDLKFEGILAIEARPRDA
jgi:hypothetical protein